jgi:DENN (AEX-3) domain
MREYFYSFFLSFRLVSPGSHDASTFGKVGMLTGDSFKCLFTSHSRVHKEDSLIKYPSSSVYLIFDYLTNQTIFTVMQHILLGRSMIFVADNPNVLTVVMNGLLQLLDPMYISE